MLAGTLLRTAGVAGTRTVVVAVTDLRVFLRFEIAISFLCFLPTLGLLGKSILHDLLLRFKHFLFLLAVVKSTNRDL